MAEYGLPNPGTDSMHSGNNERVSLAVAVVLLGLSIYILISANQLARPGGWATAPALVPMALGVMMCVLACSLGISSLARWHNAAPGNRWKDTLTSCLLLLFFVGILLPLLPFEIAATCFLLAAGLAHNNRTPSLREAGAALLLPVVISILFVGFFDLSVPGNGSLIMAFIEFAHLDSH